MRVRVEGWKERVPFFFFLFLIHYSRAGLTYGEAGYRCLSFVISFVKLSICLHFPLGLPLGLKVFGPWAHHTEEGCKYNTIQIIPKRWECVIIDEKKLKKKLSLTLRKINILHRLHLVICMC